MLFLSFARFVSGHIGFPYPSPYDVGGLCAHWQLEDALMPWKRRHCGGMAFHKGRGAKSSSFSCCSLA